MAEAIPIKYIWASGRTDEVNRYQVPRIGDLVYIDGDEGRVVDVIWMEDKRIQPHVRVLLRK